VLKVHVGNIEAEKSEHHSEAIPAQPLWKRSVARKVLRNAKRIRSDWKRKGRKGKLRRKGRQRKQRREEMKSKRH